LPCYGIFLPLPGDEYKSYSAKTKSFVFGIVYFASDSGYPGLYRGRKNVLLGSFQQTIVFRITCSPWKWEKGGFFGVISGRDDQRSP
jgi:hypothetical protein